MTSTLHDTKQDAKQSAGDFVLTGEGIRYNNIIIRLAKNKEEIEAAQALRYRVFYEEQNAHASEEIRAAKRDFDRFDEIADHLIVIDADKDTLAEQVVGNYRILRHEGATIASKPCYTDTEYDISKLKAQKENMIEVGRSCVDVDYRTKPVLQLLWQGLAEYMEHHNIRYFIGCASFRGTDPKEYAQALSYLYHYHLEEDDVCPRALEEYYVDMNMLPKEEVDPKAAFKSLPPLIKGYMRVGASVGDGAFVDEQWGSTDVCIVFDAHKASEKYRKHYARKTTTSSYAPSE